MQADMQSHISHRTSWLTRSRYIANYRLGWLVLQTAGYDDDILAFRFGTSSPRTALLRPLLRRFKRCLVFRCVLRQTLSRTITSLILT